MQKENNLTVEQWCDQWFTDNRQKWNGNTEGGYRNLIYSHILPGIGSVALSDLTEQVVTDFYNSLRSQGLSARSVWCVHLRSCAGAWTKHLKPSLFPTTRCGSARNPRQRNTKQPLCDWGSSSVI